MLHNVRYAGTGCHGKRSHSKFLFNSTVTLVPNAHPAIVSQETFDKVQEILTSRCFIPSDPESKHPRRAASPFLLSNLVYCKCCEKKMFVRNSGKDRLACSTNRTRGAGACPTRPEDMEVVETTVLRALLKKVLTEKNLRQVVQKVGDDSKDFAERQDRERETIIVKLEDIKTQKNNIIQAIAREGRHIPDLATYLDGLSQEQTGLEARKVGLDTERNALQAFLSDELRIIENASRVRTYLQSEDRSSRSASRPGGRPITPPAARATSSSSATRWSRPTATTTASRSPRTRSQAASARRARHDTGHHRTP